MGSLVPALNNKKDICHTGYEIMMEFGRIRQNQWASVDDLDGVRVDVRSFDSS